MLSAAITYVVTVQSYNAIDDDFKKQSDTRFCNALCDARLRRQ
jgi:hypothetical protein